jgi:hypothetical protein
MRLNLNAKVVVTLTEAGASIFNDHMARYPMKTPLKVAGDTYRTELWALMQVFGAHIYMGMGEVPFLDNDLEIIDAST